MSRVERAVTYADLVIIEKLAGVLELESAEFFRPPTRPTRRSISWNRKGYLRSSPDLSGHPRAVRPGSARPGGRM